MSKQRHALESIDMGRTFSSGLLLAVIALMGVGLVQVYSSSFIFATENYGDGLFFFKRQLVAAALALICMLGFAITPFRLIERFGWILWPVSALALALTFVPGIGVRVGGALRWIQGPLGFRFEPAELLKVGFVLVIAALLCRKENRLAGVPGWILAVIVLGPVVALLRQPDFGSFALISAVAFTVLFAFGLRWTYILTGALAAIPAFYFLVMAVPYRRARVLAYLDPWGDPEQKGFQIIQSLLSFHSGGVTGSGLGQGQGKLFFLPEAHTDFTLAVFGEEMGFVGFVVLLLIYAYVVLRVLQIAVASPSRYGKAMAVGFASLFGLSVFMNMAVVLGLLPTKGMTLPFMSYGGSSLVCLGLMFGLVLSLEKSVESGAWVGSLGRKKRT